jgi:hypothetical protein
MSDDFEDNQGLLDEDPALDCILYEEMNKEDGRPSGKGGCLGLLIILFLPMLYFVFSLAAA